MSKRFIVLGNQNAITYKDIFILLKDGVLWLGTDCVRWFKMPDGTEKEGARSRWFTNLDHNLRHEFLPLTKSWECDKESYHHYDGSDIINVDKTYDISDGYKGIIGVPITFLDKFNPDQFEILGIANNVRYIGDVKCLTVIDGQPVYNRVLIRFR